MKTLAAALAVLIPQLALAAPRGHVQIDAHRVAGAPLTGALCRGGEGRCHAHAVATADGTIVAAAQPQGYGANDLQAAYGIDPGAQTSATIVIVDAYGYPALESDLARYRAQYGLPACTTANGCLTVVNQNGATSPLPGAAPADDDWTGETSLDLDMASAACPSCNLVVLQTDDDKGQNLFDGMVEALALGPTVVTNSWGFGEVNVDAVQADAALAQYPGIAVFASTGDSGYDTGGMGPQYPSTSSRVIAVGGTVLTAANNARGWTETAWELAGSSCSDKVPALASQRSTACAHRASADLAAVAGSPLAVFNNGAWIQLEGTSASTPLVAGMFAATGHGDALPDSIAAMASTLVDVTTGTNGTCTSALCRAGTGWDGPTGYGTPNATTLSGGAPGGGGGTAGGTTTGGGAQGPAGDASPEVLGGCSSSGGSGGLAIAVLGLALARRRRR